MTSYSVGSLGRLRKVLYDYNGTCEQLGRFKESANEKNSFSQNQNECVKISGTHNEKRRLGKCGNHGSYGSKEGLRETVGDITNEVG